MVWPAWSLRTKLIVACLLVELAGLAFSMWGGARLLQRTLREQSGAQAAQVTALLEHAIATPFAQRDYATVQQLLDQMRASDTVDYLVLSDHRDRVVAASGWDPSHALPPRDAEDIDLDRADHTLHLDAAIDLAGQRLGRLDLGLSTAPLRATRADFLRRSVVVAAGALVLSTTLLAAIAFAITRHLRRLAEASRRVAGGDYDAPVAVATRDEIGQLGLAFREMAATIKQRVHALEQSERRQRAHLLLANEERRRLTTLLAAMPSGVLFVDPDGVVVYANAAFKQIWSVSRSIPGLAARELLPELARQLVPEHRAALDRLLDPAITAPDNGVELHTLDERIISQRLRTVADGGGWIWFHHDITLERQTQQRAHQALVDPLTRVMNRRGLYETLETAIARAGSDATSLALLFIDLDDFKYANDVGGHRTGDEILVTVARSLSSQLRRGEVIARLGGDEFAVLCPGVGMAEAGAIAERLVHAVATLSFDAGGETVRTGCSVGVAVYPGDALTGDDLIARADTAMYQAKRSGKNGWSLYRDDTAEAHAQRSRVNWNERIHRAIRDGRFVLHFQSVHHAGDLRVSHHEALVRMVDADDSMRLISPADFVPHAERSGKIRLIDRWVFAACIGHLAEGPSATGIAANLSARSLEDAEFPGFLRDELRRRDVDPRRLTIELTETSALGDAMAARRMIGALRALGCTVHLDDFGSGFASFAHLRLLDVDGIKIDGAFIRDLAHDRSNQLFVSSMIAIAHELNKTTVAEHVEDAATIDILRDMGVELVQGYHLGRPAVRREVLAATGLRLVADPRRGEPASG
jgi:diguanylate cyclase (GGDEF)-like protein